MALIEFKDLPDTTTPLTANNLNNNFIEAKKHEIATAYLTTSQENLNIGYILLDEIISNSEKLTLEGNGIKIGNGISKVKISANIFAEASSSTSYIWCEIKKNGIGVVRSIDGLHNYYANACTTPLLIDVVENDVITLHKIGPSDVTLTVRGLQDSIYNTYLTVEVVE